jgi:hypothetical protein
MAETEIRVSEITTKSPGNSRGDEFQARFGGLFLFAGARLLASD